MQHLACGALLALMLAGAGAAEHIVIKRPVEMAPSAELTYSIKARQKGFSIAGEATVGWRAGGGKYAVRSVTKAMLFGTIIDNRSEGAIDSFGLAPVTFTEKRIRHDPYTTTFDRAAKTISFTESKETYPLLGGEQDRASVSWQLVAIARAQPEKFVAGSEWVFFVAGRRDAEPWTFRVVKKETLRTGIGQVEALHLLRLPPPDSKDQSLDIWLAPSHEWYPVRLRFTDNEEEFVDQVLEKIARK
ncbi:DUF3108 domain-containing protein [Massilia sp. R2A-15]|uniref:DUF3108 domain-containing protein n=1 Tax=Massilia sp. R2A-15 TaxID=3064278 RepID=UPI002735D294|nr:DUF3108 domain-containing protein [Massilia sp. R2A-15]WLI89566.1 DUF3108 domain-containing protein [Massilia sp. R2A-15]